MPRQKEWSGYCILGFVTFQSLCVCVCVCMGIYTGGGGLPHTCFNSQATMDAFGVSSPVTPPPRF